MLTLIYKKDTKEIVGSVYPPHSVKTEINNLCNSELGGCTEDYGIIVNPPPKSKQELWEIQEDYTVKVVPNPRIVIKEQNRKIAHAKLLALGLTIDEINAL